MLIDSEFGVIFGCGSQLVLWLYMEWEQTAVVSIQLFFLRRVLVPVLCGGLENYNSFGASSI